MKKVVAIGFDGLDPRTVGRLLAAGELPNFARLQAQGGALPLATTTPAETPVAFATFATGTNPGGHGIFDFVRRDPATYRPDQALNRFEQASRFLPPKVVNLRQGTPVWQLLSDAGLPSVVIRAPCTFAPDNIHGRMLAGLGVPDLRGGLGTPTYYTSRANTQARHDENLLRVAVGDDGTIRSWVLGPRHPKTHEDCRLEIEVRPGPARGEAVLTSAGQPGSLALREGQWSDWLRVKFKLGLLQSVHGMLRFFLVRTQPDFALYASPLNFDPRTPVYPISSPPEYARELAAALGDFYTAGMAEDHTGLDNGRIDDRAFLDQCDDLWRERERMLLFELERMEEGLLFCLFDTPDRIQHMFWREARRDHAAGPPAMHDDSPPADGAAQAIDDAYRRCDAILGKVIERTGPDTLVIALSDHGFSSFRRGVHLNAWLREQGLLAVKKGTEPGGGDMLQDVDWGRTRAYAVGLSGIYLNLKGREAEGTVSADESLRIEEQIIAGLTRARDPEGGSHGSPVRSVVPRRRLYSGPCAEQSPDLVVNCAEGYRIAWNSARGGVCGATFEDNPRRWSGDHIVDPALVPGVLMMNRPPRRPAADLRDMAPTILAALGVPPGPAMEGESLLDEDPCHRS